MYSQKYFAQESNQKITKKNNFTKKNTFTQKKFLYSKSTQKKIFFQSKEEYFLLKKVILRSGKMFFIPFKMPVIRLVL